MRFLIVIAVAFAFANAESAGGIESLRRLSESSPMGVAEFAQKVFDEDGEIIDESSGRLWFSRPDKFRLEYSGSHEEIIAADGETVWVFFPDLNQVTIRPFADLRGQSAMALLSGDEIEKDFILASGFARADANPKNGLIWVTATPKKSGGNFRTIRLGFADDKLYAMVMEDALGNESHLIFSQFEAKEVSDSLFHFTPPPGADIIEEEH